MTVLSPATAAPRPAFIALMAALFATIAFAIDAMLPAMPAIAADLSPEAPNRAALVLSAFVLGMGLGTFLAGPVSDAIGRRITILGGLSVFAAGSVLAAFAPTMEVLLLARVLQGLGAAGPRVAAIALVRDLYAGPRMAQVVSFAMMVFMIVPAAAPALGQAIVLAADWRAIFWAFLAFAVVIGGWFWAAQPETLPPAARRPLRAAPLWAGVREVLGSRRVLASVIVQSMIFGALFGTLSSVQPVFAAFGKAATFPAWFAGIALVSAGASLTNALMVRRLGMYRLVRATLIVVGTVSTVMAVLTLGGLMPDALRFPGFFVWAICVFCMASLTIGNLNAITLEPLGHIAGLASSVVLAVPTVAAAVIASALGLMFDGTAGPLAGGVAVSLAAALAVLPAVRR
jgi:DHA1 family bicyclomycin/chloramphenicol resistance-like MFS transporter